MQILINENRQAQCPSCGQFTNMIYDGKTSKYQIECCRRKWSLSITKEEVEAIGK